MIPPTPQALPRRAFAAACLAAVIASCKQERPWRDVSPSEGRFRVRMPVKPTEAEQKSNTAWGPVAVRFFEAETQEGDVVYSVTYTDYPFASLPPEKAADLLARAQLDTVRRVSGEVLAREATTHQGHPARTTWIRAATGVEYHLLVVLAGSRLYQVFTASRPNKLSSADRKTFFGSFSIQ